MIWRGVCARVHSERGFVKGGLVGLAALLGSVIRNQRPRRAADGLHKRLPFGVGFAGNGAPLIVALCWEDAVRSVNGMRVARGFSGPAVQLVVEEGEPHGVADRLDLRHLNALAVSGFRLVVDGGERGQGP